MIVTALTKTSDLLREWVTATDPVSRRAAWSRLDEHLEREIARLDEKIAELERQGFGQ